MQIIILSETFLINHQCVGTRKTPFQLSRSLSRSHSLAHSFSLSPSLSFSLTHSHFLSLFFFSHSLTHTHTHTHSLSLSLSLSLAFACTYICRLFGLLYDGLIDEVFVCGAMFDVGVAATAKDSSIRGSCFMLSLPNNYNFFVFLFLSGMLVS